MPDTGIRDGAGLHCMYLLYLLHVFLKGNVSKL